MLGMITYLFDVSIIERDPTLHLGVVKESRVMFAIITNNSNKVQLGTLFTSDINHIMEQLLGKWSIKQIV